MASKVKVTLTSGADTAVLTLLDPVGPTNTWSCDPGNFLSKASGKWLQGLASTTVKITADDDHTPVLQFDTLDMYHPVEEQSGNAEAFGEGGTVRDQQTVQWIITSVQ